MAIKSMPDFMSRHEIAPKTEHFPMSKINEAFARLVSSIKSCTSMGAHFSDTGD